MMERWRAEKGRAPGCCWQGVRRWKDGEGVERCLELLGVWCPAGRACSVRALAMGRLSGASAGKRLQLLDRGGLIHDCCSRAAVLVLHQTRAAGEAAGLVKKKGLCWQWVRSRNRTGLSGPIP